MESKVTFEEFQNSAVLLPWFLHCQLWGIDTEHEDINRRVWSYMNGLYIDICKDGSFSVEYDQQGHASDSLEQLEELLWHEFAKYCINAIDSKQLYKEIKEALEIKIQDVFRDFLIKHDASGDISMEGVEHFDNTIGSIATILRDMVIKNRN